MNNDEYTIFFENGENIKINYDIIKQFQTLLNSIENNDIKKIPINIITYDIFIKILDWIKEDINKEYLYKIGLLDKTYMLNAIEFLNNNDMQEKLIDNIAKININIQNN
jgi:hypothetical protein